MSGEKTKPQNVRNYTLYFSSNLKYIILKYEIQEQVRNEMKSHGLLTNAIYSKNYVQQYQKCIMFSKIQNCSSVLTQDYQNDGKPNSKNMS